MAKPLEQLVQEATELLTKISNTKNDFANLNNWKALAQNLQQQTTILQTQVDNLKRQIR